MTQSTITSKHAVTSEQLNACVRVHDVWHNTVFYLVQSASDPDLQYEVRYSAATHKLSCTCLAGQNGLTCWHMRAALEHDRLFKQTEKAAIERAEREALLARLQAIKPLGATRAPQSSRAFSLLR